MHQYMNAEVQKDEIPDDIIALKPHIFSFQLSQQSKCIDKTNKVRYKNSLPSTFASLKQQSIWQPKIRCKRMYDQPKFLISLERKKMRAINGLQQSDFQVSQIHRNQFKSEKIKTKRQATPRNHRFSEQQPIAEKYVHNSLNLNVVQNHRVSKTPFLNFNLHHLIKQRRNIQSVCQPRKQNKKGSNLPYFALFKTERFEKAQKPYSEYAQVPFQNRNIRSQMKTTKTKRQSYNKSVVQSKQSRQQSKLI